MVTASTNVCVARYGTHPHPKGTQLFSRGVAQGLIDEFVSVSGRVRRCFGGIPVYEGHPDDPLFYGRVGHSDTTVKGWAVALVLKSDGLYTTINWSKAGQLLLSGNAYHYLSPRWVMKYEGNDMYKPVRLVSLGLTNTPNLRDAQTIPMLSYD